MNHIKKFNSLLPENQKWIRKIKDKYSLTQDQWDEWVDEFYDAEGSSRFVADITGQPLSNFPVFTQETFDNATIMEAATKK